MFSFLRRDPTKKLQKQHAALLEKAMHAQRNGDIRTYSAMTAEAEELAKRIEVLKQQ
ncbi:DUF6435 family protein [Salinimonas lutimaris]|uniref:DUF6435 family protein n=1 Tax=Salinimonas lutimaris TaxID=914153 RepID=UPI0010BF808F|nr:DUF6435 family protein [Salinimonas lutimaris]